jgi:hypothetical protein
MIFTDYSRIKSAVAFFFLFFLTEFQLKMVSKAFHITAKYWRRAGFVALLLIVAQMMDEPLMLIVSRLPAFCQYNVS